MLIFRLSQAIKPDELSEWKELQYNTLGKEVHEDRALGYCLARSALKDCLNAQGIDVKISDLQIRNHHRLQIADHLTLSLSHTKNWGAAITGPNLEYLALGIDIEYKNRDMKDAVLKRISHAKDHHLAPMTLWCLKEAAFKVLMNSKRIQSPIEFSSIKIANGSWFHADSQSKGHYQIVEHPELVVAYSWIKI